MAEGKLHTARAYIEAGDYRQAKAILETMPDSHTAQRWLKRIADRIPPEREPEPMTMIATHRAAEPVTQMPFHEPAAEGVRQRWEYCALGIMEHDPGDDGAAAEATILIQFSPTGEHEVENNLHWATVIAQLGDEGWEMVNGGSALGLKTLAGASLDQVIYFKRLA